MYTNEAHPGEHLEAHRTFDDKVAAAERLRDEVGIAREILLDDITGTVHRAYGMCPNMTWVLGKGGVTLYKAMWTSAEKVGEFCASLDGLGVPGRAPYYTEQIEMRSVDRDAFNARLAINGPRAVAEFERAGAIWAERAKQQARARRGKG